MASVRDTLISLHLEEFTGRLTIGKDQVRKVVFFKKGVPIYLESNIRSETLGQMLLLQGKLSAEQYQRVIGAMEETGRRQGEIIVEMGFMSGFEVYEALRAQLEMKFENCFLIDEADLTAEEGEKYLLNIPELPLEFFRSALDMTYGTHVADSLPKFAENTTLKINDRGKAYLERHSIQPREAKWMRWLDGRQPYAKVLEASQGDEEDVMAFVYVLHSMKFLESVEAGPQRFQRRADQVAKEPATEETVPVSGATDGPVNPRVVDITEKEVRRPGSPIFNLALQMDQPFHRIFKVHEDAPKGQVKRSYDDLIRQYHLDSIESAYKEPDEQRIARILLDRLTMGLAVMSDPKLKAEYTQWTEQVKGDNKKAAIPPAKIAAEVCAQKADLFIQKKRYDEAEQEIRKAIDLDKEESSYHTELAALLMVQANARKEVPPAMVETEIKAALKLNSSDAEAYFQYGVYFKVKGDMEKAYSAFRKLLELKPNHLQGSSEMRFLNKRMEQKGSESSFMNLFKKKDPPKKSGKKGEDDDANG